MTYNPGIPRETDIPSQSQGQMLTNFQQLNEIFDEDHVPFDDATSANRGKHDKSTYIELSADPTTIANEVAFYSKEASSGKTEVFYRRELDGPVGQLTIFKAWGVFQGSPVVIGDSFNIGSIVRNAAGNYTVNFTTSLVNANYSVLSTCQMTSSFTVGGIVGVDNRSVGSFNILVKSLTAATGTDLNPISFLVVQN